MNFVTSVFKKYINKNESRDHKKESETANTTVNTTKANHQDEELKKTEPIASSSKHQESRLLINEDEEIFQDAEIDPVALNPYEKNDIIDANVRNEKEETNELVQIQPSRLIYPDSLDNSMFDSLELDNSENDMTLGHHLDHSIEVLKHRIENTFGSSAVQHQDLEYEPVRNIKTDSLDLNDTEKVRNLTPTPTENSNIECERKISQNEEKLVSLSDILFDQPKNHSSCNKKTHEDELTINNDISEGTTDPSALEVLIRNVNHTFAINEKLHENQSVLNSNILEEIYLEKTDNLEKDNEEKIRFNEQATDEDDQRRKCKATDETNKKFKNEVETTEHHDNKNDTKKDAELNSEIQSMIYTNENKENEEKSQEKTTTSVNTDSATVSNTTDDGNLSQENISNNFKANVEKSLNPTNQKTQLNTQDVLINENTINEQKIVNNDIEVINEKNILQLTAPLNANKKTAKLLNLTVIQEDNLVVSSQYIKNVENGATIKPDISSNINIEDKSTLRHKKSEEFNDNVKNTELLKENVVPKSNVNSIIINSHSDENICDTKTNIEAFDHNELLSQEAKFEIDDETPTQHIYKDNIDNTRSNEISSTLPDNHTVFSEAINRVYKRQDKTKEFEKLENQFKDDSILKAKKQIEGIPEVKITDSIAFDKQDTKELEDMGKECTIEYVKDKLLVEFFPDDLYSEEKNEDQTLKDGHIEEPNGVRTNANETQDVIQKKEQNINDMEINNISCPVKTNQDLPAKPGNRKQKLNMVYDRQNTKEFEKLEKQFKDESILEGIRENLVFDDSTRNSASEKVISECFLDDLVAESKDQQHEKVESIQTVNKENLEREYGRQDTQEFEHLEKQYAENNISGSKSISACFVQHLVSESDTQNYNPVQINQNLPAESENTEQKLSRLYDRQNTTEFEKLEQLFKNEAIVEGEPKTDVTREVLLLDDNNINTSQKLITEYFLDDLVAKSKDQPNENLKLTLNKENNEKKYSTQDTKELEYLKKQYAENIANNKSITAGLLEDLVVQNEDSINKDNQNKNSETEQIKRDYNRQDTSKLERQCEKGPKSKHIEDLVIQCNIENANEKIVENNISIEVQNAENDLKYMSNNVEEKPNQENIVEEKIPQIEEGKEKIEIQEIQIFKSPEQDFAKTDNIVQIAKTSYSKQDKEYIQTCNKKFEYADTIIKGEIPVKKDIIKSDSEEFKNTRLAEDSYNKNLKSKSIDSNQKEEIEVQKVNESDLLANTKCLEDISRAAEINYLYREKGEVSNDVFKKELIASENFEMNSQNICNSMPGNFQNTDVIDSVLTAIPNNTNQMIQNELASYENFPNTNTANVSPKIGNMLNNHNEDTGPVNIEVKTNQTSEDSISFNKTESISPKQIRKSISKVEVKPNVRSTNNVKPVTARDVKPMVKSSNKKDGDPKENRNGELEDKVDSLQQELDCIKKSNRRKGLSISTNSREKEADKKIISKYGNLLLQYEEHISQQASDLEKLKLEAEINVRHFNNTEMAFSDLFEKYEKAKYVITLYRSNEDILLENIQNAEDQLSKIETKCQLMQQQSFDQIKKTQEQVEQEKRKYNHDITKLQAQVKMLEIKASSLETAFKQKSEECRALVALCDDITGRNST